MDAITESNDSPKNSDRSNLSIVFIGSGFLFIGILMAILTIYRIAPLATATGWVSFIDQNSGSGMEHPCRVTFHDLNGTMHGFLTLSRHTRFGPDLKAGQEVEVLYNPSDPSGTAEIKSFFRLWSIPTEFILVGLVFLGIRLVRMFD